MKHTLRKTMKQERNKGNNNSTKLCYARKGGYLKIYQYK